LSADYLKGVDFVAAVFVQLLVFLSCELLSYW